MHWILVIFVILIPLALLLAVPRAQAQTPAAPPPATNQISTQQVQALSQAELEKRLQQLEQQPPPPLKMGAMCYEMAAPPQSATYVCPKCGEKTLYPKQTELVAHDLPACRRELDALKTVTTLGISLDESSFCQHCSPDAKQHELVLSITYPDGTVHKIAPIRSMDLVYLRNFLSGKQTYSTFNNATEPLKKEIPRLRQLLGLTGTDNKPPAR